MNLVYFNTETKSKKSSIAKAQNMLRHLMKKNTNFGKLSFFGKLDLENGKFMFHSTKVLWDSNK